MGPHKPSVQGENISIASKTRVQNRKNLENFSCSADKKRKKIRPVQDKSSVEMFRQGHLSPLRCTFLFCGGAVWTMSLNGFSPVSPRFAQLGDSG